MSPTIERIITLSPDAIFMSPYEGGSYAQLENIGAAIIECADYMETSALGRAEWMRFYGMLTGKENTADSLFAAIERNYKTIVSENNKQKKHPKVLTERVTNGVWYCPGGNSSMAKLIKDAGGKYIFADNNQSGSLNLSPEMVINKSTDADVWLFIYYGNRPLTRNELTAEYSGYKSAADFLRSFKLDDIITLIVAAEDVRHAKPDPEPVLKTLKHYHLQPEDAVVVGDTHFDILMGRNAHCMTVGVTYGNGSRESLMEAGADAIVDDFAEIAEMV
jgi:hypothetical protein